MHALLEARRLALISHTMRFVSLLSALPVALLASAHLAAAAAPQLGIKNGKLSIVTKDGTTERDFLWV